MIRLFNSEFIGLKQVGKIGEALKLFAGQAKRKELLAVGEAVFINAEG